MIICAKPLTWIFGAFVAERLIIIFGVFVAERFISLVIGESSY